MRPVGRTTSEIEIPDPYDSGIEIETPDSDSVSTLRPTFVKDQRDVILEEGSEDWVIAKKIYDLDGMEKALMYLKKSGFTQKSMNKFKKAMVERKRN